MSEARFVGRMKRTVASDQYQTLQEAARQQPHPSRERLCRYALGQLSEPAAMVVRKHLLFCQSCLGEVAGFLRHKAYFLQHQPEYLPQPVLATELWEPEFAGQQVTAADIPQQEHIFHTAEGDLTLRCHWGAPYGSDPAYLWLSYEANLSSEKEFVARFLNPDTQDLRYQAYLGDYRIGEATFTDEELGFDPTYDKWAISIELLPTVHRRFELKTEERDGVTIIKLRGQLTLEFVATLKSEFNSVADSPDRQLVLELSTLEQIDSSGLGVILSLLKRIRARKGDVKLVKLHGQPQEIFHLLRLDRIFEVYDNVETAIQSL
jgi:anti-anti-sigma factor